MISARTVTLVPGIVFIVDISLRKWKSNKMNKILRIERRSKF